MGVYGRSMYDWDYATYCDYGIEHPNGQPNKRRLTKHFSRKAAERSFQQLRKVYSHESRIRDREFWRLWQEDRQGNIINDTGKPDPVTYV